jgi:hypothetical protein
MKRHLSLTLVMLAMLLLPAVAAQAQMLKVAVPFDFSAGQATLPAGDYIVSKPGNSQNVLVIRAENGGGNAFVMTAGAIAPRASDQGKLVFNRYGSQYFLSQVWAPGTDTGHQLRPSKAEREIAKNASKPKIEVLTAKK